MPDKIIGAGEKQFHKKEEVQIFFYAAAPTDCRVKCSEIFAVMLPGQKAIVYGEYVLYFLYSYSNAKRETEYRLQSFRRNFSAVVPYSLQEDACSGTETDDLHNSEPVVKAQAVFTVTVKQVKNILWQIETTGNLSVRVMVNEPEIAPEERERELQPAAQEEESAQTEQEENERTEEEKAGEQAEAPQTEQQKAPAPLQEKDTAADGQGPINEEQIDSGGPALMNPTRVWRLVGMNPDKIEELLSMDNIDLDRMLGEGGGEEHGHTPKDDENGKKE